MYSVGRGSNLTSAAEDTFIFGLLKEKCSYLETILQASVHMFFHPCPHSVIDIIHIISLILPQFECDSGVSVST